MPNCASTQSWSECSISNESDNKNTCSTSCVECEELTPECASYAGAGYGKCVPKSCVNFCCKNNMPKIPEDVKTKLVSLSNIIIQKVLKTNDEQKCQIQNFGTDDEIVAIFVNSLFEMYQNGELDIENISESNDTENIFLPPEMVDKLQEKLLQNAKQKRPCFNFENNNCVQGEFANINNVDELKCNTNITQQKQQKDIKIFNAKTNDILLILLILLISILYLKN